MSEAVFFRLLDVEDKAAALVQKSAGQTVAAAVAGGADGKWTFVVESASFRQVPGSPFAYWAREESRALFRQLPPFESQGRTVKQGLATADDFRFVRLWWEVSPVPVGYERRWIPFAKGGSYSPFYADVALVVGYSRGDQVGLMAIGRYGRGATHYFRPGLTWPLRTQSGLALRLMPAGCIFGHKGPAAFIEGGDASSILALLAVTNSVSFRQLVGLQMAFGSFEVGVIQRTPVPVLEATALARLAQEAKSIWLIKRGADSSVETSHAFVRPALLRAAGKSLRECAGSWKAALLDIGVRVDEHQTKIDSECRRLYGVSEYGTCYPDAGASVSAEEEDVEEPEEADGAGEPERYVAELMSYAVGVGFGRWDVRHDVDDQKQKPEPFDPLPVCSPGMLHGDGGLPLEVAPPGYPLNIATEGVLVDDPGHGRDIGASAKRVFDVLFAQDSDSRWIEAGDLLEAPRSKPEEWLRTEFFAFHLQQYSRSRRKAPIYWQLAVPSARYSVWLYLPLLKRDTLFSVLEEVKLKLRHEERQLETLRTSAGPSVAQRKELDVQESFVEELRTFREEVARVAPLWNPHLDDGVLINFAPLWRLVPQHRAWQKECMTCWEELAAGEYDWSHLAMHLWPERVVPRCREDRSLAIAHGLEAVFWAQDEDEKWAVRPTPTHSIESLVQERTSLAVREARDSLLSALSSTATSTRRSSKPRKKARNA